MLTDTIEVFVSYSKQDKELRDGLLAHLRPLETKGVITWSDRQILPGARWDDEIKARLNAADIILLLISSDFLNTDYCTQVEIPEALRRHRAEEAIVMPVILRSCAWNHTPLADIQAYPEKAKPIKTWKDIDEAYTNVVNGVYLAVTEIQKRRSQQQVEQPRQQPATETEQIENLDDYTKLEMVRIAGGRFWMGSPDAEVDRLETEGPQHRVEIQPFWMGKYPVTQEQWWVVATKFPKINRDLEPEPSQFKGDRRPVEQVSWYDAIEFCERLSRKTKKTYRLPSEAEWEYACRAKTTAPFYFGNTIAPELANFSGEYGGTTDVGTFQPNAFGLYDMHGNVWEWCADHGQGNYQGAPIDGSAWLTAEQGAARMMRGGSWGAPPRACRSACRNYLNPDYGDDSIGFRVVCGLA